MPQRDTLKILDDILDLLEKEKELSIMGISEKINARWSTTRKALLFLKKRGLVKERKGRKALSHTRLFSLVK